MILSVFLINHYWPLATILAIELIVTLTFHKIIHVGKVDPFAEELLSRIFGANYIIIAISILATTTITVINYLLMLK